MQILQMLVVRKLAISDNPACTRPLSGGLFEGQVQRLNRSLSERLNLHPPWPNSLYKRQGTMNASPVLCKGVVDFCDCEKSFQQVRKPHAPAQVLAFLASDPAN